MSYCCDSSFGSNWLLVANLRTSIMASASEASTASADASIAGSIWSAKIAICFRCHKCHHRTNVSCLTSIIKPSLSQHFAAHPDIEAASVKSSCVTTRANDTGTEQRSIFPTVGEGGHAKIRFKCVGALKSTGLTAKSLVLALSMPQPLIAAATTGPALDSRLATDMKLATHADEGEWGYG